MSVNSSSSSSSSSNDSSLSLILHCITPEENNLPYMIYNTINILFLLPTCSFVLYLGLQRWRRRSSATAAAAMSHSDSFNYHMVAMQLVGVCGSIICCCGIFSHRPKVLMVGTHLLGFNWIGEIFFHTLTCLERYLAVVHPITYLSLKTERGVRIRNITNACVWLLCFTMMFLLGMENAFLDLVIVFSFCIVTSFCSLSVLCALTHPGPGGDQSKQRAFYTITAILAVLWVKFFWTLIWAIMFVLKEGCENEIMVFGLLFNVPSSLVLSLIFLHRSRKVACWNNENKT